MQQDSQQQDFQYAQLFPNYERPEPPSTLGYCCLGYCCFLQFFGVIMCVSPAPPPLTPSARLLRLLIHKILNPKSRHGRRPQEIRASFLNRGCCLRRSVWAGAAGAETAVTLQALAVISGTDLIHRPVQGQLGGVTPAVQGLIYIINIWAPLPSAAPYKDSARPSSRSSAHAAPGAPCTSARRGARPPCQLASS